MGELRITDGRILCQTEPSLLTLENFYQAFLILGERTNGRIYRRVHENIGTRKNDSLIAVVFLVPGFDMQEKLIEKGCFH